MKRGAIVAEIPQSYPKIHIYIDRYTGIDIDRYTHPHTNIHTNSYMEKAGLLQENRNYCHISQKSHIRFRQTFK